MSEITWEQARIQYVAKQRSKESLYPSWQKEVSALGGIDLAEHPQQGDPLFQNGWPPDGAAEHLRIVWILKGWEVKQIEDNNTKEASDGR